MRFAEMIGHLLSNATPTEEEYIDISRKMSTHASQTTLSFADLMFAKGEAQSKAQGEAQGEARGKEIGKDIGQIAVIAKIMRKHPDWSDQQVADFVDIDIALARKARRQLGDAKH